MLKNDKQTYKSYVSKIVLTRESGNKILNNLFLVNQELSRRKKARVLWGASASVACAVFMLVIGYFFVSDTSFLLKLKGEQVSMTNPPTNDMDVIVINPFGSNQEHKTLVQFQLGSLIYGQISNTDKAHEDSVLFTDEYIKREHVGKEIGTVAISNLSELINAKIYEYTPVLGNRVLVVQKDDKCSLFRISTFNYLLECTLADVFEAYGIVSAQDVRSIKISKIESKAFSGETVTDIVNVIPLPEMTDEVRIAEFLEKIKFAYKDEGLNKKISEDVLYEFTLELSDGFIIKIDFRPHTRQIEANDARLNLTSDMYDYLMNLVHS